MKQIVDSTIQCTYCGTLAAMLGATSMLWNKCAKCGDLWCCSHCEDKHKKICGTLERVGKLFDLIAKPDLDLGTLPDGTKITIDPSERCEICDYGVRQIACDDCKAELCPACVVGSDNLALCAACFMNREG